MVVLRPYKAKYTRIAFLSSLPDLPSDSTTTTATLVRW